MLSPDKYELELAPLALLDIEDILQYTQETYGANREKTIQPISGCALKK